MSRSSSQMEASGNSDAYRSSSSTNSNHSRRHGVQISASTILRSPLSTLLECSGILRTKFNNSESDTLLNNNGAPVSIRDQHLQPHLNDPAPSKAANSSGSACVVSIRIIASGDHEHDRSASNNLHSASSVEQRNAQTESFMSPISWAASSLSVLSSLESQVDLRNEIEDGDGAKHLANAGCVTDAAEGVGNNRTLPPLIRDMIYNRLLGGLSKSFLFTLILSVVFIWQHLQGFFWARDLFRNFVPFVNRWPPFVRNPVRVG